MSHFSVLVVTDAMPTHDAIQEILLPWHEYECTGIDRYCEWVDRTDEAMSAWEKASEESKAAGLAAFLRDWGGWQPIPGQPGKFGRYTNPRKKWDWWAVGGRWSGNLRVKDGAPSLTGRRSLHDEDDAIAGVDACRKADLDWEAMRADRIAERQRWADDCRSKAGCTVDELDLACRVAPHVHAQWVTLPEPRPRGGDYYDWAAGQERPDWATFARVARPNWELPETKGLPLADWIAAAPPLMPRAVVIGGEWHEKGEMGWWGVSHGDKDNWESELFPALLERVRPEQWITVADCHI